MSFLSVPGSAYTYSYHRTFAPVLPGTEYLLSSLSQFLLESQCVLPWRSIPGSLEASTTLPWPASPRSSLSCLVCLTVVVCASTIPCQLAHCVWMSDEGLAVLSSLGYFMRTDFPGEGGLCSPKAICIQDAWVTRSGCFPEKWPVFPQAGSNKPLTSSLNHSATQG